MDQIYSLKEIVDSMPCGYGEALGKYPFISNVAKVSNISADGLLKNDYEKRSFREDELKKLLVEKGDLLVVKSSGSKSNILSGKTAFCTELEEGKLVASNFLLRLKPKKNLVIPRYLWYILNSQRSKNYVKTIVGATTYPNLKWPLYGEHPVPLPSLYDQTRIAKILDHADNIRRKNRQILEKYNELARSLFYEMFGDPQTNNKNWDKLKLGELADDIRYGTNSKSFEESENNLIPVLRIPNVAGGEVNYNDLKYCNIEKSEYEKIKLKPGDLLFVRSNGNPDYIGRCAVFNSVNDYVYASYIIRVRLIRESPILPNILSFILNFPSYRSRILKEARTTAGNYNLNTEGLKSFEIILPHIYLQNRFLEIMQNIESQKINTRNGLEKSEALFQSLLQRAF